jgi:uncharacterized membrane protein
LYVAATFCSKHSKKVENRDENDDSIDLNLEKAVEKYILFFCFFQSVNVINLKHNESLFRMENDLKEDKKLLIVSICRLLVVRLCSLFLMSNLNFYCDIFSVWIIIFANENSKFE